MNYEKSLEEIKRELVEYFQKFLKLQEEILGTMQEIDEDIGFALENKDVDHAGFLQMLFLELQEIAGGTNPLSLKQLKYIIELIDEQIKKGEHGEEHKATTEA